MAQIKTQKEFESIVERIEELLPQTWGKEYDENDPLQIELNLLSELVAEYEDEHVHLESPKLVDTIKLRLFEMGLTQSAAAKLLGISTPHMSAIMNGKNEPSLSLARNICIKLNIDPAIALGV